MAAKFLGQFLLERGTLTPAQLLAALDAQRASNPLLGELAIHHGMLDALQARRINERQRAEDRRFGDIALEMGWLSEGQLDVLLAAQKHVTRHRPLDPGEKTAVFGEETQTHVALAAEPHQKRTAADIAEAGNGAQSMQRHAQSRLAIDAHRHSFAVLGEVGALGGDKQGVEVLFHTSSTILRR